MKRLILILFSLTILNAGSVKPLTNKNFNSVINSNKPVLVKFWASWCRPCQILEPRFEDVAKEYKGKIIFAKVNVDANVDIANRYYIRQLPTIVLFYKGQEIDRLTGLPDRVYLREWANKILDYLKKQRAN